MSMTREEATEILRKRQRYCKVIADHASATVKTNELREIKAIDMALSALRPFSRAQVEKVWKSEWIDNGERDPNGVPKTFAISCKRCGSSAGTSWMRFCPACGAPMTDEAVQMVMERMEELKK